MTAFTRLLFLTGLLLTKIVIPWRLYLVTSGELNQPESLILFSGSSNSIFTKSVFFKFKLLVIRSSSKQAVS